MTWEGQESKGSENLQALQVFESPNKWCKYWRRWECQTSLRPGVLAVLPDFLSLSSLADSNVYFNTILHCLPTKGDIFPFILWLPGVAPCVGEIQLYLRGMTLSGSASLFLYPYPFPLALIPSPHACLDGLLPALTHTAIPSFTGMWC